MSTKKQKRIWKIVKVILILVFAYFIIVKPIKMVVTALNGISQQLPDTKEILPEYRSLLDSLTNSQLKAYYTYNSKKRNPVSVGVYKEKFIMVFYHIDFETPFKLKKVLSVRKSKTRLSSEIAYVSVIYHGVKSLMDFNFATAQKPNPKKIYLTIEGNTVKRIKTNDSVALINMNVKRASIQFQKEGFKDIVISAKDGEMEKKSTVPLNLAFIKKYKSLYIIAMSIKSPKNHLLPESLLKMIK